MAAPFELITPANTYSNAVARFMTLREALEGCEDFYQWISAYSAADLQGPPLSLSAAGAQALLNAAADAHQLRQMFLGTAGFPTATLPYNFSASMRQIIGPQK